MKKNTDETTGSTPNIFSHIAVNTITKVMRLQASIWRFDPAKKLFNLIGSTEKFPEEFVSGATLSKDDSIAGSVYKKRKMETIKDISKDTRWKYKDDNLNMGFKSAMVTPLKIKGEIIGVLDVYFSGIDFEDANNNYINGLTLNDKKEAIEGFANQISIAIRQLEGLEKLNQVNQLISSELKDYNKLLLRVTGLAQNVLRCNRVSIYLYDKKIQKLELKANSSDVGHKYFEPGEGVAGYVYHEKETILIPDVDQFRQYKKTGDSKLPIKSMIGSPIFLDGNAIGVLCADMDQKNWFDEFDITIVNTLANQASIAIKNYELYTKNYLRQNTFVEIGNALGGKFYQDEIEILELIFNQALKLDIKNLSIALYDKPTRTVSFVLASRNKARINVEKEDWKSRSNGNGKTEEIINNCELLLLNSDQLKEEKWRFHPRPGDTNFETKKYPKTWIGVPMKIEKEVIGVIADYRYDQGYTKDDISILEALAHYAALAIQGLRFYKNVMDKEKEKLEKILGINNLKQIAWMETGLKATRSVCRILIATPKGIKFATGFLIQPNLLMTNHHVIADIDDANSAKIEFDYQLDFHRELKTTRYRLNPSSFFITNAELDYTFVDVDTVSSKMDLHQWGCLQFNENADPLPGEYVNIIQHPNGGTKQVVLAANEVTSIKGSFISYTTDTMPGSSGSPVFNDLWQVIAIHHSGGSSNQKTFENEGVLLSAIFKDAGEPLQIRIGNKN